MELTVVIDRGTMVMSGSAMIITTVVTVMMNRTGLGVLLWSICAGRGWVWVQV